METNYAYVKSLQDYALVCLINGPNLLSIT